MISRKSLSVIASLVVLTGCTPSIQPNTDIDTFSQTYSTPQNNYPPPPVPMLMVPKPN